MTMEMPNTKKKKREVGLGPAEDIQSQKNTIFRGEQQDRLAGQSWIFFVSAGKRKCVDV